ncbi:Nucleoprotein TPR [Liparis tanakae]|uniref:Nucleoprotein TPR n=1 Tax=Liparis tanakae TaxID=230148 RepID=A0A4Z2F4L5_9TELE|nr:Nucleoprotein TPR [Liparis tanakae]
MEASYAAEQPISSSGSRLPQSPRRPTHLLPPRLNIAPTSELGPPAQVQRIPVRRQSVGRVPTLTPGVPHFFDEDDRMVPSTPTLVLPQRSDGFDQTIHSPQVAGVPRFRFGLSDDVPQTSSSSSDLGQLASHGGKRGLRVNRREESLTPQRTDVSIPSLVSAGLGMYESPLFLATHEEESGGRTVPTTPSQVSAPVTIFSEAAQSDAPGDHASQSVPMVSTSTPGPGAGGAAEDDVFLEPDADRSSAEVLLDPTVSQGDSEDPGHQPACLPSTSQEPSSSSADTSSAPARSSRPASSRQLQRWPEHRGGRMKRGGGFPSRGVHGRRFAR